MGMWFWGFGVGQFGFAGCWDWFLGSMCCVGTCGIEFRDWIGGIWGDLAFVAQSLGIWRADGSRPQKLTTSATSQKKIKVIKKIAQTREQNPPHKLTKHIPIPIFHLDRGKYPYRHNFRGQNGPATSAKIVNKSNKRKKLSKQLKLLNNQPKPSQDIPQHTCMPITALDRGICPYEGNFRGQNTPVASTKNAIS